MKSVVIDFKNSLPFFPLIRDVVAQWEFVQVFTPFISLNVGNMLYVQVCFEFYIKKESKFASKKKQKSNHSHGNDILPLLVFMQ